jgi:hypothetical protein
LVNHSHHQEDVMLQIFQKAPVWVWPLFMVLIAVGWMQSRTRSVPPQPMIIISSAMLCLSGFGVISAFQSSALALLAWLAMLSLTLLLCQKMGYPQAWHFDASTRRMHVPGSWLPMALYLSIFLIKFAVGAALGFRPEWAKQLSFALPVSALYGLLSGIFATRALHALRISRSAAQ